jgi:hypothetical protein
MVARLKLINEVYNMKRLHSALVTTYRQNLITLPIQSKDDSLLYFERKEGF